MAHNPDPASRLDFNLPSHAVLALEGPDAMGFAQAQFMNDVALLADGTWQWNGWLTPKGRVIALFALLRRDAETLWLVLPDVTASEFVPLLQRYVFRSKVRLARVDAWVAGSFREPVHADGAAFAVMEDGRIELDMSGDGGPRSLSIHATPARDDPDAVARWAEADLAHGLPRLPAAQREQWTPQQLSLDRLRAFSLKKGCYPGQEIVARTHFLGQVKRGLFLLEAAAGVSEGGDVFAGSERSIGTIACTAGQWALAVMPLDAADAGLHSAGIALKRMPLLGGLAR